MVEYERGSVGRGVRRSGADPYRPFSGDILAQRPCLCAPRIADRVRPRGGPGSVVEVQRPRLESGRAVCRRMLILRPPITWVVFSNVRLGRGERLVSGGVLFGGRLSIGDCSAAVENGLHVGARLLVWRDAVIAPHGARPGVVGGESEHGPELVRESAQVGDAGVDVLSGVEGIGDAEVALRARHQLHQALGAGRRLGGCAVRGLDGDDRVHQVGVDAVPLGGHVDDVGERERAGLGRSREEAGGAGDEQQEQEQEATVGEKRWRHGERARYHMRGAGRCVLRAGSRRRQSLMGSSTANERAPGLGGDHDVGVTLSSPMPLGRPLRRGPGG